MEFNKLVWSYYCVFTQNLNYIFEYEKNITPTYIRTGTGISSKGWDFINSSTHFVQQEYNVGDEFKERLIYAIRHGMVNPHRQYRYLRFNYLRHSKINHYVRQSHHLKKELNEFEVSNLDWRKKKGFNKDHKKCGWKRGAGKHYKRLSNRMHRQWQKECIHNNNYEAMHDLDYKLFLDPWMWD